MPTLKVYLSSKREMQELLDRAESLGKSASKHVRDLIVQDCLLGRPVQSDTIPELELSLTNSSPMIFAREELPMKRPVGSIFHTEDISVEDILKKLD